MTNVLGFPGNGINSFLVVSHVFAKEPKLFRKLAVNINEERLTNNNGDATDAGRVKQTV